MTAKNDWWLKQAGLSFPHVLAVYAAHHWKEDIGLLYQNLTPEELIQATGGSLEVVNIGHVICRKLDIINELPNFIKKTPIGTMMWGFMEDTDPQVTYPPHSSFDRMKEIIYEKMGTLCKQSSWWETNKREIHKLAQRTNKTKKLLES